MRVSWQLCCCIHILHPASDSADPPQAAEPPHHRAVHRPPAPLRPAPAAQEPRQAHPLMGRAQRDRQGAARQQDRCEFDYSVVL